MDDSLIYSALYEGSLLFGTGTPVADMYQQILAAYTDASEVVSLFKDLVYDWDHPSGEPLKMVHPFKTRAASHPGYRLAALYTELAAGTSMVDTFWGQCGMAYLLKQRLARQAASQADQRFARELLSVCQPGHPMRAEFRSWSPEKSWSREIDKPSEEFPQFDAWLRQLEGRAMESRPLRSRAYIENESRRLGSPELVAKTQEQWDSFSKALSLLRG